MRKQITIEARLELSEIAQEEGGFSFVPPFNRFGVMEGVPHIWAMQPTPKIIVYSDKVEEDHKLNQLTLVGFDTKSHEYLTIKEFLKQNPDCKHIEIRALSSLKKWEVV